MSCNIIDDFRQQYELALDEIYDLQGEIDELVDECCQQKQTIHCGRENGNLKKRSSSSYSLFFFVNYSLFPSFFIFVIQRCV
jgi:FtsZ-binding cell division protein ZapB